MTKLVSELHQRHDTIVIDHNFNLLIVESLDLFIPALSYLCYGPVKRGRWSASGVRRPAVVWYVLLRIVEALRLRLSAVFQISRDGETAKRSQGGEFLNTYLFHLSRPQNIRNTVPHTRYVYSPVDCPCWIWTWKLLE